MKNIIDIRVRAAKADLVSCKTDVLVVGVFSETKRVVGSIAELDKKLGGAIKQVLGLGDFKGTKAEVAVLYANSQVGAKRIMLVGLGDKGKLESETVRKAVAAAANKAVNMKADKISVCFMETIKSKLAATDVGKAVAEGAYFGAYRYDEYVTGSDNGRLAKLVCEIIDTDAAVVRDMKKGVTAGSILGQAQNYARTIANRPGNVINPPTLAAEAKRMARSRASISCTVFNEKQLTEKGMGGILAVGSGSKSEPRLIVLKYTPKGKKAAKLPKIGLVGKAVTFDSGGISIKPSPNMEQMKFDKSGGIAVLATMRAIADLGLDVHVTGFIPSAENMPGGKSYRPGDIVTTFSGKTVEVQNTDAEGRMILCDAINYAAKQGCDTIVDIATLTGACMVALGKYKAGLMSNDDKLVEAIEAVSKSCGESVWHLPCGDEYTEEMKSKIADLKNIGSRWGGASTAASFLREFVEDKKWAHIDMAGVDMFEKSSKFSGEGSTGFGVGLLTNYVMSLEKS